MPLSPDFVPKTTDERFFAKVRLPTEDGCWPWIGARTDDGYGSFWNGEWRDEKHRRPVTVLAHRWIYEHLVGEVPEGLYVLHHCDNPWCVYPKHLFVGTQADNVADCVAKGRRNYKRSDHFARGKLSHEERVEIRRLRAEGLSQVEIAARFNVSPQTVAYWEKRSAELFA